MKRSGWRWLFRLSLASILAIGIGYLPYRMYGPNGVARALRLEQNLQQLTERIARLQEGNRVRRERIRGLKDDRSYIEQVARDELGMVRPHDIVFQFEGQSRK